MNATPVPTKVARTGCGGFTDETENLSTTCRQSKHPFSEVRPPCKISEILSNAEFTSLALHLHNGNGPHDFGMAIAHQDGSRGHYAAKKRRFEPAVASAWSSIVEQRDLPFAVIVHAKNCTQMSCWAAFDIDAHTPGQRTHAEWMMRQLGCVIRRRAETSMLEDLAVLFEDSGRGFHIWLISPDTRSVADWNRVVRSLLKEAGIEPKRDGIETYPSGCQNGLGRGLRLPGNANVNMWNPAAGSYPCSMILGERGLIPLIGKLPKSAPPVIEWDCDNKRDSPFVITSEEAPRVKMQAPKVLQEHVDAKRLLERYAINSPSSRHNQLCSLVGDGFFHFSRKQLRRLAEHQHNQASPSPGTCIEGHLVEFEEAYEGMLALMEIRLSAEERGMLQRIMRSKTKEAFIIAQNFARHAAATRKWGPDAKFPFSGLDLATRLGENTQTAYRIRADLINAGCIRKVEECRPRVAAQKYVWLLCIDQTGLDIVDA